MMASVSIGVGSLPTIFTAFFGRFFVPMATETGGGPTTTLSVSGSHKGHKVIETPNFWNFQNFLPSTGSSDFFLSFLLFEGGGVSVLTSELSASASTVTSLHTRTHTYTRQT